MNKSNKQIIASAVAATCAAAFCLPFGAIEASASPSLQGVSVEAVAEESTIITDIEAQSNTQASKFSIPAGAFKMNLNVNGRSVLAGRVFNLGGTTYVPMFKFADWLGVFTYSTHEKGGVITGTVEGKNLKITATEGSLYISANGRYFYTVGEVLEISGEIYVPIRPLVKALNCYVDYDSSTNCFVVRSGDTSLLKHDWQVYNPNDVYWLARIISAEARGESFTGKMAVGNVVLNRMRSAQFPNTIKDVIFDTKYGVQFSPTANGTIYNEPTAESIIAAKVCIEGYSLSSEILYFFNPKYSTATWIKNNRPYAFTIQNHEFYK
jgi:N-acetylmuramoyl-L-alanine amidase